MTEAKFKTVMAEVPISYMDIEGVNQGIQEVIDGKKESYSFQCKQFGYYTWSTVRKITEKDEIIRISLYANVGDVIIDHGARAVNIRYGLIYKN